VRRLQLALLRTNLNHGVPWRTPHLTTKEPTMFTKLLTFMQARKACPESFAAVRAAKSWDELRSHPQAGGWADWALGQTAEQAREQARQAYEQAGQAYEQAYGQAYEQARQAYE